MQQTKPLHTASTLLAISLLTIGSSHAQVSKQTLESITTPDKVETSIGTLNFMDGAPLPETVQKVYGYLDTMRGVDVFLKGMRGASMRAMMNGAHNIGAVEAHQVYMFDKLMDSKSLYLTANISAGMSRRQTTRKCAISKTMNGLGLGVPHWERSPS